MTLFSDSGSGTSQVLEVPNRHHLLYHDSYGCYLKYCRYRNLQSAAQTEFNLLRDTPELRKYLVLYRLVAPNSMNSQHLRK